jgi:subtilase family serine protease
MLPQAYWSDIQMRTRLALVLVAVLAACGGEMNSQSKAFSNRISTDEKGNVHMTVCSDAAAGEARCHAHVRVDGALQPLATAGPTGYNPADLIAAYKLPSSAGTPTVAIVDAFDDPNAELDLAHYRAQFGLPACTTANGCFKKVGQTGGAVPASDSGWAQEISLDLDMVSAICPNCHILLVEATTNSFANLAAAVDFAATQPGVVAISNSYGGGEYAAETTDQAHYNHPGKAITVSSGDSGFGVEFPAAAAGVTAVGGTTLTRSTAARGFTETVWSGAGSGCSGFIAKPTWQKDTGCARRTVADVSAVADPSTGVSVYDTFGITGGGGWLVFGGTSVAAPVIAAVYALSGNAASVTAGSFPYAHTASLFDVTSGKNTNRKCTPTYLCTGSVGYDGPSGLGTPNGTGAF